MSSGLPWATGGLSGTPSCIGTPMPWGRLGKEACSVSERRVLNHQTPQHPLHHWCEPQTNRSSSTLEAAGARDLQQRHLRSVGTKRNTAAPAMPQHHQRGRSHSGFLRLLQSPARLTRAKSSNRAASSRGTALWPTGGAPKPRQVTAGTCEALVDGSFLG